MCAMDLGVYFTYADRLEVSLKYISDMFCTKYNALYISWHTYTMHLVVVIAYSQLIFNEQRPFSELNFEQRDNK